MEDFVGIFVVLSPFSGGGVAVGGGQQVGGTKLEDLIPAFVVLRSKPILVNVLLWLSV